MEVLWIARRYFRAGMGDIDPRGVVATILLIIAALLALQTSTGLLRGEVTLREAFRPEWVNFALAHPMLFALIVTIGVLLLGGAFVTFLDSM